MTRIEFLGNVNDWPELIEFCNDMGCRYCDDVYFEKDIHSGYDYYRCDNLGNWEGLDDFDFADYKNDVLGWMDGNAYWDDFDEEPMENCDNEVVEAEDFSVAELIAMCSASLAAIQQENMRRIQKDDEQFKRCVNLNIPKVLK